MTRVLGVVAAVLLGVASAPAQQTPASGDTDAMLIANERALLEAVTKADNAAFSSLVLDEGGTESGSRSIIRRPS